MTYTLRFVIPSDSASVLLVPDGSGWALPRVDTDEPEIVLDAVASLRDLVDRDVFVLRDVRFGPQPPPDDAIVYATESIPERSAARGRWSSQNDLRGIDITDPREREALRTWFADEERRTLQPWQREGWIRKATEWIEETLSGVSEVAQYATWCNSCILRVTSGAGRSWFKACPAYFAREPVAMVTLEELMPGWTPRVLGLDADRGWMLLEDIGNEPLDMLPAEERIDGITATAELHRAALPLIEALLAGGCLDRRPNILSSQIAALAVDDSIALPGDLQARFQAQVPGLQELCAQLASGAIPSTLVHGDLHGGNIMRRPDRHVFFDWSDACIADPFVDVSMFLSRLPDDAAMRERFLDRYLEAWADAIPRDDLRTWIQLAEPLAAMHHAVTYRGIFDAFGESEWWIFEGSMPRWIEQALASPLLA